MTTGAPTVLKSMWLFQTAALPMAWWLFALVLDPITKMEEATALPFKGVLVKRRRSGGFTSYISSLSILSVNDSALTISCLFCWLQWLSAKVGSLILKANSKCDQPFSSSIATQAQLERLFGATKTKRHRVCRHYLLESSPICRTGSSSFSFRFSISRTTSPEKSTQSLLLVKLRTFILLQKQICLLSRLIA